MKKLLLIFCLLLTLRLYDGTVVTYGSSWNAKICPVQSGAWILSVFSTRSTYSRDARSQLYDIDDVQLFKSNGDTIVFNSEIVTKNEGLWINCNE
jgi:predicted 2-oxoglutarate/Fe(II)-dependent dioxygenase YbiX